ncbi:MAG TPA: winged helix-turn-helix transcriptional regulator [Thermoplasmata archaeon]|nr:winged helix-turn-helix transcriptional regulator [Thermoplasmata archaeon]
MKEDYLALDTRKKIFELISNSPGLHKREIARELKMSLSTVDYHLHYMEKRKIVFAKRDGKYKRYFVTEKTQAEDKRFIPLLRQETPRRIILFLLQNPRAIHKEICREVKKAPSTVSFHLKKLIETGIIEEISLGKERAYIVKNPEKVADLIITYKSTFLDKAVDKFVNAWVGFGK